MGGMIAPAGISEVVVRLLNREVNHALVSASVKEKYAALGNIPTGGTPEEFMAFIKREVAKWSEVIKGANIRAD